MRCIISLVRRERALHPCPRPPGCARGLVHFQSSTSAWTCRARRGHRARVGSVAPVNPPGPSPSRAPDAGRGPSPASSRWHPGVHRMPLPLPMDGLRAVNVYVIETSNGLVLVDGGWAIPPSRDALRVRPAWLGLHDARHPPVPGHPHAPRPLHAGLRRRPGGRGARRARHRRQAEHGPDARRRPVRATPTSSALRAAGAESLAAGWRNMMPRQATGHGRLRPARPVARPRPGDRPRRPEPGRGLHARPHPGSLRVRRPGRRSALRRRPRAVRPSRPRSASSRRTSSSRCATTSTRWPRCARCRT